MVAKTLDDKSRLLLKDLLDSAVENVFNVYSKVKSSEGKQEEGLWKEGSIKAHCKKVAFLKPDAIGRLAVEKIENVTDSKLVQKPVNALRGLIKHARRAKRSELPLRGSHGKTKTHSKAGSGFRKRK